MGERVMASFFQKYGDEIEFGSAKDLRIKFSEINCSVPEATKAALWQQNLYFGYIRKTKCSKNGHKWKTRCPFCEKCSVTCNIKNLLTREYVYVNVKVCSSG